MASQSLGWRSAILLQSSQLDLALPDNPPSTIRLALRQPPELSGRDVRFLVLNL
jgi:hypothetical protein